MQSKNIFVILCLLLAALTMQAQLPKPVKSNIKKTNVAKPKAKVKVVVEKSQSASESIVENSKFVKGIKIIRIPGKNFYMSETEVTIGEYLQFCKETNSHYPIWLQQGNEYNTYSGTNDKYKKAGMTIENSNYPITGVNWFDAVAFCTWLGRAKLPSLSEWEYVAKGGENYNYAGSNEIYEVAWFEGNSDGTNHPVKSKKPNGYGLYDMTGSVNEWTNTANKKSYLIKGGSWYSHISIQDITLGGTIKPINSYFDLGFRFIYQ